MSNPDQLWLQLFLLFTSIGTLVKLSNEAACHVQKTLQKPEFTV